jgi:predicted HTH transcriptional regulator
MRIRIEIEDGGFKSSHEFESQSIDKEALRDKIIGFLSASGIFDSKDERGAIAMQTKSELLAELRAIVSDAEEDSTMGSVDLLGIVAVFVGTALQGGTDAAAPIPYRLAAEEREAAALELATVRGAVTSGQLAKATTCHPETARLTLRGLVAAGRLRRIGARRGARYLKV